MNGHARSDSASDEPGAPCQTTGAAVAAGPLPAKIKHPVFILCRDIAEVTMVSCKKRRETAAAEAEEDDVSFFSEGYYREYYAYASLSRPCYQWRHLVLRRLRRNPIIKWRIFRYDTGSVSQSELSHPYVKRICHLWLRRLWDQVQLIRAHMKRMDEVD